MDNRCVDQIRWIHAQLPDMVKRLHQWVEISSGSEDLQGLLEMRLALEAAFTPLGGTLQHIPLLPRTVVDRLGRSCPHPQGEALHIAKRPDAPLRVFFGGHMDTVYSRAEQTPIEYPTPEILKGPGVTDMKGGLVIMLTVLQAIEQGPLAEMIGWEVLINPDEETGSTGSEPLLRQSAARNDIGLLFEPAFPDGAFVSTRKGSASYAVVVRGRAAHAGRDFHMGRNAIVALAQVIREIDALNIPSGNANINVGVVEGGEAINIVPDLALCRLNVRSDDEAALKEVQVAFEGIVASAGKEEGVTAKLVATGMRCPKRLDAKTTHLFSLLETCAKRLHIPFQARPTGGVCDGNILAEAGLPTIDTLGVVGGKIHTAEEYCFLPSLTERAALVLSLLFEAVI